MGEAPDLFQERENGFGWPGCVCSPSTRGISTLTLHSRLDHHQHHSVTLLMYNNNDGCGDSNCVSQQKRDNCRDEQIN